MQNGSTTLPSVVRLHVVIAVALSVLVGTVTTVQLSAGLSKFGGLEYVPRISVLSAVRVLGPAVSGCAGLFAILIWTHRVGPIALRRQVLQAGPWVALMTLLAVPLTTALLAGSGFLISTCLYRVPWETVATSVRTITIEDAAAALSAFAWSVSFSAAFGWFAFPAMSRRSWSLTRKVGATLFANGLLALAFQVADVLSRVP